MARIRTVKPEFWKHEELSALPESVHMLAAALLNYADDEGYFNANDKLVKAECSPLREPSVSTHDALKQLSKINYLRLGNGPDGKRYGHVINFDQHQRVNRKTDSKIKKIEIVWESSVSPHPQLTEGSPPEGKGKEGKEDAEPSGSHPKNDEAELFDRGKKVLGKDAGGLIAKLLKSKKEIPLARAAIETAATKQNPREYIGRILSGPARAGPVLMENGQPYPDGII
jgi:hypothetical protein